VTTLTAKQVLEALHKRWPAGEYVAIEEAPADASRMGRKIDLLVVSCWASRGFSLDAVEVKVSTSDWKRELDNPVKADFWWRHADRFWVAAPAKVAEKIAPVLPETWGLLGVSDEFVARVVVQAPKHEREPLSWPTMIGVLRAAQDAGFGALQRAEARGYDRGAEEARRRGADGGVNRAYHDELVARVCEFERVTGLHVSGRPGHERFGFTSLEDLRDAVAAVIADRTRGERAREDLARTVERLRRAADEVERVLEPEAVSP
jgi:hypothetical protein